MNYGTEGDLTENEFLLLQTFENSIGNINVPNYLDLRIPSGSNPTLVEGLTENYERW